MATAITLASELPGGRMRRLGKLWTYFAEWRSLEEELARLERVSLEELREVASAYPMEPRLTGILRPGEA